MSSHAGQSNYLNISVQRRTIRCLIDTGSTYSLISSSLAAKLNLSVQPVNNNNATRLYAAQGSPLKIVGTTILQFYVAGISLHNEFFVVDNLSESILIGLQFLESNQCCISFTNKIITFWNNLAQAPLLSNEKQQFARTTSVICVKPYSEMIIKVSCPHRFNGREVRLDPLPNLQFVKFALARSVGKVRCNQTVCRILNFKPEALVIPRNSKVAVVTNTNVERDFDELNMPSDDDCDDTNDSTSTVSKADLEQFATEYGFTINPDLTASERTELLTVLYKYRSVFALSLSDLKRCPNYELKLNLKPNSRMFYKRQYKLSLEDTEECHRQIKDLQASGLIEKSKNSMTNIAIFLVAKGHGSTERRLVLDLRPLNAIVESYNLEMPDINDLLNNLAASRAKYFSTCDLKASFWQVGLHPDSRELTSFTDPKTKQRYQWCVTPFGLANSVSATIIAIFESLSSLISQNIVHVYLDDIALTSMDFKTHLQRLKILLKTLKLNHLSLNAKKTKLAMPEINYLGYRINSEGISLTEERIRILKLHPEPRDKRSLMQTLGLFNFLRRHVEGYTTHTYHMRQNLKADRPFVWDENCKKEFRYIISALTSDKVMKPIDSNKPFHIYSDASYYGCSWSVMQEYEGVLCPVLFSGRALTRAQRSWTVVDIELASIYYCLHEIHHYVGSQVCHIYSDNLSLCYLNALPVSSPRHRRISAFLMQFNLVLHFIPGKKNCLADSLSRSFKLMPPGDRVLFLPTPEDNEFLMNIHSEGELSHQSEVDDVNVVRNVEADADGIELNTQDNIGREYCYHTVEFASGCVPNKNYNHLAEQLVLADGSVEQSVVQGLDSRLRPDAKEFVVGTTFSNTAACSRRAAAATGDSLTNITDLPPSHCLTGPPATLACAGAFTSTVAAAVPVASVIEHTSGLSQDSYSQGYKNSSDVNTLTPTPQHTQPTQQKNSCTDSVMAVRRRRHSKQSNNSPTVRTADNSDSTNDAVQVNDAVTDANDDQNTDQQQTDNDSNSVQDITFKPDIKPTDYESDSEFSSMYAYLSHGTLTGDATKDRLLILLSEDFLIDTDQIMYKITFPRNKRLASAGIVERRICLPFTHRNHAFRIVHNLCGHAGRDRLFSAMRSRFYYKTLYADCMNYASSCIECLRKKSHFSHVTLPLHPLAPATFVGERWAMDHLTLPRKTADGGVAILVILDCFSKYCFASIVDSLGAVRTAHTFLATVVATFGLSPKVTVVTDKGTSFSSRFFRTLADLLSIKLVSSATAASRTNGQAEAYVKQVKEGLRLYAEDDLKLSAAIPIVEMALRSQRNSTGFSAFELVHGYKMPLPNLPVGNPEFKFTGSYKDYLDTVVEKLTALKSAANENLDKVTENNVLQYNKRHNVKPQTWSVGTRVLLRMERLTDQNKVLTRNKYDDGYLITKVVCGPNMGVAYQLTRLDGRVLKNLVSHDRIKLDTSVKRDDTLTAGNPVSQDTAQNPVSDATSVPVSTSNDSNCNGRNTDGVNTPPHQLDVSSTSVGDSNTDDTQFYPAIKILREKKRGASKQYYVQFESGERAWCSDVSPALLNAWLVTKAARTARRRHRRRS